LGGNLLLDISVNYDNSNTGTIYLDARNGDAGGLFSRKYASNTSGVADNAGFDNGWGMVTQFTTSPAATSGAPAPSTLSAGVGLLGCMMVFGLVKGRKACNA
jgi:hypothetical protein